LMAFGLLRADRLQYYTRLCNPYCFVVIGESSTNGIYDKGITGFRPFRSLTTLLGLTELWMSQLVVSKRWIERTTETAVPPRRYIAQRSAVKCELVLF
uniref:IS4 family transposase n=1 Tax=Toxocara canis TaxID=6265 RepID=A0A183VB57_TOXCA